MMSSSEVSIVKGKGYDEAGQLVKKAVDLIGGIKKFVRKDDVVIIKPNLTGPAPARFGLTTHPAVIEAIIRLIYQEANPDKVVVAENPAFGYSGRETFKATEVKDAVEGADAKIAYLDEEKYEEVEVPNGRAVQRIRFPKMVLEADTIIDVPKMKTHGHTVVTLGIKNWQGLLSWEDKKKAHHDAIHQKFVDLHKVVHPRLTIIDGIVAMEGQGPAWGDLVNMGLVIAGNDPVAVDFIGGITMGISPIDVPTTRIAAVEGLGQVDPSRILLRGLPIKEAQRIFTRAVGDCCGIPGVTCYIGAACGGCRTFAGFAAFPAILSGKKVMIIVGQNPPIPERLEGEVYVIGDCAEKYRDKGEFLPGCAPIESCLNKFYHPISRMILNWYASKNGITPIF